jgi:hypothetical protein
MISFSIRRYDWQLISRHTASLLYYHLLLMRGIWYFSSVISWYIFVIISFHLIFSLLWYFWYFEKEQILAFHFLSFNIFSLLFMRYVKCLWLLLRHYINIYHRWFSLRFSFSAFSFRYFLSMPFHWYFHWLAFISSTFSFRRLRYFSLRFRHTGHWQMNSCQPFHW